MYRCKSLSMVVYRCGRSIFTRVYRYGRPLGSENKFYHSLTTEVFRNSIAGVDEIIANKRFCCKLMAGNEYTTFHAKKLHCSSRCCCCCCDKKTENIRDECSKLSAERSFTIPNVLCVSRIIAAPISSYFIINSNYNVAIGIVILASITDFMDGFIARKFSNQATKLGSFLDPLADKIFAIALYASLTYMDLVPGLLTALMVFRDVSLLTAGFYIRYLSLSSPKTIRKYFDASLSDAKLFPTYISKINTAVQLFAAIVSLFAPNSSLITETSLRYTWYTAGCLTILSSISYLVKKNSTFIIFSRTPKKSLSKSDTDTRNKINK